ncbi:hypothetical protein [Variovorax sp. KK3]|uniref:hypothetical protein n=1 Tax=Variovorax sp. KK3 TaxID=1855728 RepID=UPI00097BD599|nr:hypothetical protein [Variovorax sp. KK3]
MSERKPPRFVPTLTAVLEEQPGQVPEAAPEAPAADLSHAVALSPQALLDDESFGLEEQLLHRVLQRIDLSLEERLTDAVSAAVQQQLDNMIPKLRVEIEQALRALISEALARELSDNTGSTPAFRP